MATHQFITITDLARDLGIHKTSLLAFIKKHNFRQKTFRVRTERTKWQAALAVTPATARVIKTKRRELGWPLEER